MGYVAAWLWHFSQFLMILTAFVLMNFSNFLSVQHTLKYQGGCGAC